MTGRRVTKEQVKIYMKARQLGNNQEIAAAKSGVSVRMARLSNRSSRGR